MSVGACLRVCSFANALHMCTVKLTAVGYDHPQSKETKKKENQACESGDKKRKEDSVLL